MTKSKRLNSDTHPSQDANTTLELHILFQPAPQASSSTMSSTDTNRLQTNAVTRSGRSDKKNSPCVYHELSYKELQKLITEFINKVNPIHFYGNSNNKILEDLQNFLNNKLNDKLKEDDSRPAVKQKKNKKVDLNLLNYLTACYIAKCVSKARNVNTPESGNSVCTDIEQGLPDIILTPVKIFQLISPNVNLNRHNRIDWWGYKFLNYLFANPTLFMCHNSGNININERIDSQQFETISLCLRCYMEFIRQANQKGNTVSNNSSSCSLATFINYYMENPAYKQQVDIEQLITSLTAQEVAQIIFYLVPSLPRSESKKLSIAEKTSQSMTIDIDNVSQAINHILTILSNQPLDKPSSSETITLPNQVNLVLASLLEIYKVHLLTTLKSVYSKKLRLSMSLIYLHIDVLANLYSSLPYYSEKNKLFAAIIATFPDHDFNIENPKQRPPEKDQYIQSLTDNKSNQPQHRPLGVALCLLMGLLYNSNFDAIYDLLAGHGLEKSRYELFCMLLRYEKKNAILDKSSTCSSTEKKFIKPFGKIFANLELFENKLKSTRSTPLISDILLALQEAKKNQEKSDPGVRNNTTMDFRENKPIHFIGHNGKVIATIRCITEDGELIPYCDPKDKNVNMNKYADGEFLKRLKIGVAVCAIAGKVATSAYLSSFGVENTYTKIFLKSEGHEQDPYHNKKQEEFFKTLTTITRITNGFVCAITRGKAIYIGVTNGLDEACNEKYPYRNLCRGVFWFNNIAIFLTSTLGGMKILEDWFKIADPHKQFYYAFPIGICGALSTALFQGGEGEVKAMAAFNKEDVPQRNSIRSWIINFVMAGYTTTLYFQLKTLLTNLYKLFECNGENPCKESTTIKNTLLLIQAFLLLSNIVITYRCQGTKVNNMLDGCMNFGKNPTWDKILNLFNPFRNSFKTHGLGWGTLFTVLVIGAVVDSTTYSFGCMAGASDAYVSLLNLLGRSSMLDINLDEKKMYPIPGFCLGFLPQFLLSACYSLPKFIEITTKLFDKTLCSKGTLKTSGSGIIESNQKNPEMQNTKQPSKKDNFCRLFDLDPNTTSCNDHLALFPTHLQNCDNINNEDKKDFECKVLGEIFSHIFQQEDPQKHNHKIHENIEKLKNHLLKDADILKNFMLGFFDLSPSIILDPITFRQYLSEIIGYATENKEVSKEIQHILAELFEPFIPHDTLPKLSSKSLFFATKANSADITTSMSQSSAKPSCFSTITSAVQTTFSYVGSFFTSHRSQDEASQPLKSLDRSVNSGNSYVNYQTYVSMEDLNVA